MKSMREIVKNEKVIFPENWKHFVLFYEDNPDNDNIIVHHLVGYETVPDDNNVAHNFEELVDDPDFGYGERARKFKAKLIDRETALKIMKEEPLR